MSYVEDRVRVRRYGTLPRDSKLLVPIAGVGRSRRLHTLAAAAFERMRAAVLEALEVDLRAASGWRPRRWASWADYERTVIKRFGSVREGRRWLAYQSPHETGLAVDFGTGGLWPTRSTVAKQRATPLHGWLVENAHRFGWHPYKVEPWHWEYPLPFAAWETGILEAEDDADDDDPVEEVDEADEDDAPPA